MKVISTIVPESFNVHFLEAMSRTAHESGWHLIAELERNLPARECTSAAGVVNYDTAKNVALYKAITSCALDETGRSLRTHDSYHTVVWWDVNEVLTKDVLIAINASVKEIENLGSSTLHTVGIGIGVRNSADVMGRVERRLKGLAWRYGTRPIALFLGAASESFRVLDRGQNGRLEQAPVIMIGEHLVVTNRIGEDPAPTPRTIEHGS